MSHAPPSARPLPGWVLVLGSLVIVVHLLSLGMYVLSAPSGPWPMGMGANMAQPPQFAATISNALYPYTLRPLKMMHNYHFLSSRPAFPGVRVEIKLKNEQGKVIETVQLPDPKANFWVQHRQQLLARGLAEDQPVEMNQGEEIPGVGKKAEKIDIWDGAGPAANWQLVITPKEKHMIPRDRPVMRPSEYSRILARSFVRHLCRQTGAASGEVIRISHEPITPNLVTTEDVPPGTFNTLTSNFGEMSK